MLGQKNQELEESHAQGKRWSLKTVIFHQEWVPASQRGWHSTNRCTEQNLSLWQDSSVDSIFHASIDCSENPFQLFDWLEKKEEKKREKARDGVIKRAGKWSLLNSLQVLCFDAYYQEAVHERREEQYRVRQCKIYFYLEDDSIQVSEPRIKNSGVPQGNCRKK